MKRSAVLALLGMFVTGCSDSPTAPEEAPVPLVPQLELSTTYVTTCELIDFEEFDHGEEISAVSVLGQLLSVSVVTYDHASTTSARAFHTDGDATATTMEDGDLQWRGDDFFDPNLGSWKEGDRCPDCEPLGKVMVIEDPRGFLPWGDHRYGGEMIFQGFPMGGTDQYYVKSFTVVDDEIEEPAFRLVVDGDTIGESVNAGDGQVTHETVMDASSHPITTGEFKMVLGTIENDRKIGSGALDNVELCRVEEFVAGDEGCTLGFWKTHLTTWMGYDPEDTLEEVFDVPDYLGLDDQTLLDALGFGGGPGALGGAKILLKQAVAALLNAAHPDVDYAWSEAQVIAEVNSALAGTRQAMTSLAEELDDYNNAECTASGPNTTGQGNR